MHDLRDYVNGNVSNVFEEAGKRGRPRKNPAPEESEYDKINGKSAESNGSGGAYAVNPPVSAKIEGFKLQNEGKNFSKNKREVARALVTERPFFIQGRAGWGKTSVVLDVAGNLGYEVIVFYLDKCDVADLAGRIYVDENGREKNTIPVFIQEVAENTDKNYLLFFDEMNQAQPEVMNALMPIIHERTIGGRHYDNLICGAAGNLMDENLGGVSELSKPLAARLKKINWESHTEDAWKDAIEHLVKKHKFPQEFFDFLTKVALDWFDSPRDIELNILNIIEILIKKGQSWEVEEWKEDIEDNVVRAELLKKYKAGEKITPKDADIDHDLDGKEGQADIERLSRMCYDLVANEGELTASRKSRKVGAGKQVPENLRQLMKEGISKGYIQLASEGDTINSTKYAISAENIVEVFVNDGSEFNAETIQKVVDHLTETLNFKYNTDDEWKKEAKKLNLVDPLAPETK
jgi:hypothetical protein